MEEEISSNSDLPSPYTGVGKLYKESSRRFFVENFGIEKTAEKYKEIVNELWEHSDSEKYSPISAERQIEFIVAKIKKKLRAKLNSKTFQKLDESVTSIFFMLNELHAILKIQSSGLQKMEHICKEIEFAMQEETDMQRHKFKDIQSELLEIKIMMQTMATVKYKTCSCFSSEKIHNKKRKNSGQEGKDVNDDEFLEGFLGSSSAPVQSCRMGEILVVTNENKRNYFQKGRATRKPRNAKLTDNAETAMPCINCSGRTNFPDMPLNACPPEICRKNIFLVDEKENNSHFIVEEQNSGKCKNLQNNGSISNFQSPETCRGSVNDINGNKENMQFNGLGPKLSSSAENCHRCNIIEPSQANECMSVFDKDIIKEEMLEDMDLMDSLSDRLAETPENKVKVLNSITAEKQISQTTEHTHAFKEHYTDEKKTRLNVHLSAEKNHHTSRKRWKCQVTLLRRPSHRFNELEVECLICAVTKFGTGRWRDIREMYYSTFKLRTAADLKDKWRSLLHSAMRFSINKNFRTAIPVDVLKQVYSIHMKGH